MNTSKKHQLQPDTLLDERYRILGVLGEGGFGITYVGINERINVKVAIKEFFWRDYVTRDTFISPEVLVISEDHRKMITDAREKFMEEARVIGDFINEPSIVDVIDYFEANETAYIVMNYLEGITLKEYLKNKGPFKPEDIFRKMMPLMEGLSKVHNCGIIHRDISPDNIMIVPNGSLKLLDFGAARDYSGTNQKSYSVIVKGGYAPVEQYHSNGTQGPWTDIYALCATLYECITGTMPDDALQRVFYDELKKPSEMNIKIDNTLEKILWKGLSVSPDERYRSIQELLTDIRLVIKDDLPEKKQSRLKKSVLAASAAVLLLFAGIAAYTYADNHIAAFKFRGVKTETVILIPDEDISAKDYKDAKAIIENRLAVFTGGKNYILNESDDNYLYITTPLDVYHSENINLSLKSFISRPIRLFACCRENYDVQTEISPEDIVSLELKSGDIPEISREAFNLPEDGDYTYLEMTLTDEKIAELKTMASDLSQITFAQDIDRFSALNCVFVENFYSEDSQTFYLFGSSQDDNILKTMQYNFTHEKTSQAFTLKSEIAAEWEVASQSIIAGDNQVDASAISNPAVILKYTSDSSEELSNGQWYNVIADIKTRMDALDIPYAFGISEDDDHAFTIKLSEDDACAEVLYSLGSTRPYISHTWDNYFLSLYLWSGDMEIQKNTENKYALVLSQNSQGINALEEKTTSLLENGPVDLYIDLNGCKLLKCELTEPVSDGILIFDRLNNPDSDILTESDISLLNYIYSCLNDTSLPSSYSIYEYYGTDADGNIDMDYNLYDHSILGLNENTEIKDRIHTLLPDSDVTEEYTNKYKSLDISFDMSLDSSFMENLLTAVADIYDDCQFETGSYDRIFFSWNGTQNDEKAFISIYKSTSTHTMDMYGYFYGERFQTYADTFTDLINNSDFYKSKIENGTLKDWTVGTQTYTFTSTERGNEE